MWKQRVREEASRKAGGGEHEFSRWEVQTPSTMWAPNPFHMHAPKQQPPPTTTMQSQSAGVPL